METDPCIEHLSNLRERWLSNYKSGGQRQAGIERFAEPTVIIEGKSYSQSVYFDEVAEERLVVFQLERRTVLAHRVVYCLGVLCSGRDALTLKSNEDMWEYLEFHEAGEKIQT